MTYKDKTYKETIEDDVWHAIIVDEADHLTDMCHGLAKEAGWWHGITGRDTPRLLMLCVTELAEAMEADRKNLMDDHLPNRAGLEVELADCVIRIFDMAGGLKLDVAGAIADKLLYNVSRSDHKPENRAKLGGKKY
jgi:NTP pyrophosphatase (non-canonical NTP hydrolase)